MSLEMGSGTEYSGILRLLMMVEKKVFKTSAVLLSVLIILSFSIIVIFSSDGALYEKKLGFFPEAFAACDFLSI